MPKGPEAKAKAEAEARGYEAEAKILARGQFGLEALTSLVRTPRMNVLDIKSSS